MMEILTTTSSNFNAVARAKFIMTSLMERTSKIQITLINPHQTGVSESIRQGGGANGPPEEINYIGYIFAF